MQKEIANKPQDGPNTSCIPQPQGLRCAPFNASDVAAAERGGMHREKHGEIHRIFSWRAERRGVRACVGCLGDFWMQNTGRLSRFLCENASDGREEEKGGMHRQQHGEIHHIFSWRSTFHRQLFARNP